MMISIVVPCYNEEEALPHFLAALNDVTAQIDEASFEILLVNDGSRDNTLSLANAYAQEDPRIRVLSFSRNFGKEAALLAGLSHATGSYISVMDADLQDPPSLLVEMLEIIKRTGCDCVAASRVTRAGEPPVRSLFARTFYRLVNKLSAVQIKDGARDFRLMRREMVDAILSLGEYRRFSKGIFAWVGFDVQYVTYENVERVAGVTKWSFWGLLRYALEGIFSMSATPLLLPWVLAIPSALACIVMLFMRVWPAALLLGLAVLVLSGLGILGQYLGRVYWEVKRRPLYILLQDEDNQGE